MTASCPHAIGGATVLLHSPIDDRHRSTGNCKHTVGSIVLASFFGLAICKYDAEDGFYLFYCDQAWQPITDTWHQTLADAMDQAEFEFEGVSATWIRPESSNEI